MDILFCALGSHNIIPHVVLSYLVTSNRLLLHFLPIILPIILGLTQAALSWRNLDTALFTLKTHQMFSVHTTLEEFENGGFTLKTHQMFSVHTTLEEVKNGGFTLKTHQMFSVHTTREEFKKTEVSL